MIIKIKNNASTLFAIMSAVLVLFSQTTMAITKCKDADGNWHYGDVAVAQCEDSKVTTLNDRGFVTEEIEAPKSIEERQAEEARMADKEAEAERLLNEKNERLRILSIYETEDDIDRLRDNQLSSIESNIAVHEAYLKSMDKRVAELKLKQSQVGNQTAKDNYQKQIDEAQGRIATSTKGLEDLKIQKEEVVDRFVREKEMYRELKLEVANELDAQ